jgi:hypothetical protein
MVTARGAQGMSATSSHALMPLRASALNSRMIFAEPSRYWIRNCTLEILALILVDGSVATLLLRCALPRTSTAASPDWRAPRDKNCGPPAVRGRYAPRYCGSSPANPFIEDGLASRSLGSSAVGVVALCGNPRKLLTRRLRLRDLLRSRWRASLQVSLPWSRISGPRRRPAPAGGPAGAVGDNAASNLVNATKRRRADDGRLLHDDESRSLKSWA